MKVILVSVLRTKLDVYRLILTVYVCLGVKTCHHMTSDNVFFSDWRTSLVTFFDKAFHYILVYIYSEFD